MKVTLSQQPRQLRLAHGTAFLRGLLKTDFLGETEPTVPPPGLSDPAIVCTCNKWILIQQQLTFCLVVLISPKSVTI